MSFSIQLYKDLLAIGTNITIKSGIDREALKDLANIANKSNVLLNVRVDSCISIDELKPKFSKPLFRFHIVPSAEWIVLE